MKPEIGVIVYHMSSSNFGFLGVAFAVQEFSVSGKGMDKIYEAFLGMVVTFDCGLYKLLLPSLSGLCLHVLIY